MGAIWVYAEVSAEGPHPAALELLTKARSLCGDVAAVALGPGATAAAPELGAHGAATVYANDEQVFADQPGRPAAHTLRALIDAHTPSMILFAGTYDARDVSGRLQALTGSTLMANATEVESPTRVRTEIFGGTKYVDVDLAGPEPRLVLVRPKSFPAEPSGDTATVVAVDAVVPEGPSATVIERHAEAAGGPKLEEANVVIAGGRGLGGPDPFAMLDDLAAAEPVFEVLAGWPTRPAGSPPITSEKQLPESARRYIARVSELIGLPIALLSFGPGRSETLLKIDPFATARAAPAAAHDVR